MASSDGILVFCTAKKRNAFGAYDENYTFMQPVVQTAKWS